MKESTRSTHELHVGNNVSSDFSAHWLTDKVLAVKVVEPNSQYYLAKLNNHSKTPQIIDKVALQSAKLSTAIKTKFPHLSSFHGFSYKGSFDRLKPWLKDKIAVIAINEGLIAHIAYVQIGEVLDVIYASKVVEKQTLGAKITKKSIIINLWAPTAKEVKLKLFDKIGRAHV